MKGPRELLWTPQETAGLVEHARVVAGLRAKVEAGSASKDDGRRFAASVFVLDRAMKDKENPSEFAELRRSFDAFYRSHDLPELADALPADIRLTPEQHDHLKAKQKEGYTRMILVPAGIERHLAKLKTNLTDGLGKTGNGQPVETYLSDDVKSSFPGHIRTVPPREVAYIVLTDPNKPLLDGSKGKTPDDLIPELQAAGLTGLTLADFLIEERLHFDTTGKHLIDGSDEWTWLLSSRDAASHVLRASWESGMGARQIRVKSNVSHNSDSYIGVRPSVVLELVA